MQEDEGLPTNSQQSSASQSELSKFAAFKDRALTASQRTEFDLLLLKGIISANLPFTWIDNQYIKEAFEFIRPQVQLPSRRSLAGELSCGVLCYLMLRYAMLCCAMLCYAMLIDVALTGPLLKKAVREVEDKLATGMQNAKQGATMSYDAWTDTSKAHLLATSLTTSSTPRQVCKQLFL